jgi:hypothetical protein
MSSKWIVSTDINPEDPKIRSLLDDAIAGAPSDFIRIDASGNIVTEDTIQMLPRKPLRGKCSLCGKETDLTKEHIPPRASGNKERTQKHTLDDWLQKGLDDTRDKHHPTQQGGIWGYTLCRYCNSLTGTLYGNEYVAWAQRAKDIMDGFEPGTFSQLDNMTGPFGWNAIFGSKEVGSVKPGAMVRQVLSCMCSLSGAWDLAERHPEIKRIILEQSEEALPKGIELGMHLYVGPMARISGPQLMVNVKEGIWRWCQEIAYPPFAFLLVIASNKKDPGLGLMMGDWTSIGPSEERYFEGVVEVGFGWTPYPGDYRSKAQISGQTKLKTGN